ncbi:MAG: 4Fe-4S dicluster domain-containing protein [Acidobacteria bacterium]|nr:4Fe-4S dicluster domain-containing protein [Acidobacteriota bacterium]
MPPSTSSGRRTGRPKSSSWRRSCPRERSSRWTRPSGSAWRPSRAPCAGWTSASGPRSAWRLRARRVRRPVVTTGSTGGDGLLLEVAGLEALLAALRRHGYGLVGPRVRDGAVVYDTLGSVADLPAGWTDEQEAGRYRLVRRNDAALFGFGLGPHSWKRFLFPPSTVLWHARRADGGFEVVAETPPAAPLALVGVRPCELAALAVQDRVLLGGPWADPDYRARREALFVVAVHCTRPGATCFCASLGTGPRAPSGFDLALTEIPRPDGPAFLLETGTAAGEALAAEVPCRPASDAERREAESAVAAAAGAMGRALDPQAARGALGTAWESPRWEAVARRCLACGNCTLVCPTCFCSTVEDTSDLAGETAARTRRWDTCFGVGFSYVHGGSVRTSVAARYRQWITHKLATWHEQFGTCGCVGCGRCITWCPAGIDITEEARAVAGRSAGRGAS